MFLHLIFKSMSAGNYFCRLPSSEAAFESHGAWLHPERMCVIYNPCLSSPSGLWGLRWKPASCVWCSPTGDESYLSGHAQEFLSLVSSCLLIMCPGMDVLGLFGLLAHLLVSVGLCLSPNSGIFQQYLTTLSPALFSSVGPEVMDVGACVLPHIPWGSVPFLPVLFLLLRMGESFDLSPIHWFYPVISSLLLCLSSKFLKVWVTVFFNSVISICFFFHNVYFSLRFFYPFVSRGFLIDCGCMFTMTALKSCQIIPTSDSSRCHHLLIIFSHSNWDVPGSWYDM